MAAQDGPWHAVRPIGPDGAGADGKRAFESPFARALDDAPPGLPGHAAGDDMTNVAAG